MCCDPFYWLSSCALCLLPRELPAASRIAVHKGPCLEPRCCLHETSASRIPTSLMTCAAGLALAFSLAHTSSLPLALGRRVACACAGSLPHLLRHTTDVLGFEWQEQRVAADEELDHISSYSNQLKVELVVWSLCVRACMFWGLLVVYPPCFKRLSLFTLNRERR